MSVIDEGARLAHERRVASVPDAEVFHVAADDNVYTVVLSDTFYSCNCPAAWELCAHVGAAMLHRHEVRG